MCRARVSGPSFRAISMRKGAGSCPATRCGSASRRGTMSPPPALTSGEARRSRCGCRASRSCARRPAPRRGTWPPRRTRSPRRSASWGRGRGTWHSSGPARPAAPVAPRTRATDRALERLAEAQQQLKAQLERSEELFRRAAVEGALASLAADAEDLRRRQAEWNREDAARPDSAGAAHQRALADRADSLARGIDRVATDLRAGPRTPLAAPQQAVRDAGAAMQRAAQAAGESRAPAATEAGTEAEQQMAGVPEALRGQRDSLAREWRGETLAALDR